MKNDKIYCKGVDYQSMHKVTSEDDFEYDISIINWVTGVVIHIFPFETLMGELIIP